jgi:hypothetical protein
VSKAISDTELRKLISKLGSARISPKEIRHALEISASPLVDELKYKAPMKIIRDDIGIISKPSKYPQSILVGLKYTKGAISNLAYAFEYGTEDRYTKKKFFRGRLQPGPWFRPTVDGMKAEIVTSIKNELAKIVESKLK